VHDKNFPFPPRNRGRDRTPPSFFPKTDPTPLPPPWGVCRQPPHPSGRIHPPTHFRGDPGFSRSRQTSPRKGERHPAQPGTLLKDEEGGSVPTPPSHFSKTDPTPLPPPWGGLPATPRLSGQDSVHPDMQNRHDFSLSTAAVRCERWFGGFMSTVREEPPPFPQERVPVYPRFKKGTAGESFERVYEGGSEPGGTGGSRFFGRPRGYSPDTVHEKVRKCY
jgi:hypothetical protein